jgi:HPt (histidine-containing phosphotransfer) domain-containing protein
MIAMTAGDGKIPAGLFVTLLIKPFSPETLLATVTDTLTRTGHQRPYEGLTWKSILAPAPDQPWAVHDARTPQALFQQDLDRNLHELDHYLTTLDWHGANRLLHRWCGAASLLGFWRMAALCRRMQGQLLPTVSTAAVADTYYALSCEAAVVGKSGALQQD